jgi:hypothetical protein
VLRFEDANGGDEVFAQMVLVPAWHWRRPVTFTAHIQEATAQAAVLTAELEVDRSEFGMTWSPLHTASMTTHGTIKGAFCPRVSTVPAKTRPLPAHDRAGPLGRRARNQVKSLP